MGLRSFFRRKKSRPETPPADPLVPSRTPSFHATVDELDHVFRKFDVNGDGKISASELGAILSSLGYTETEEELAKMVKEVDADGDGCISFQEFVELNTAGIDGDEILENLKEAFSVYDRDGNGEITAEELHEVLMSLGEECSLGECRKMISGVDRDGDGMISFEEFKVMMTVGSRLDVASPVVSPR
ncbi:hypothetical protein MLD38_005429 [Melastoma candidum]|uniref:Uncharacterized protein n=1 Tax=Melastoma candidum TaxID=119954 RepID=A0ACB9RJM1_9MYRT|nr:hypothetical protein MLD38_005429 [Melastoma candidum]